jgi:hypothetical protein
MDPYDPAMLKSLSGACYSAKSSRARGAALEDLAEHVLTAVPSVRLYARDVKDQNGTQEIDLILSHLYYLSSLPMPDVTIIVECKNETRITSSTQVSTFGNKIRRRGLGIGILVTTAGLSGSWKPPTAAHAAVGEELSHGAAIIVVNTAELANLSSSDELVALLNERLLELRTYRTYRSI